MNARNRQEETVDPATTGIILDLLTGAATAHGVYEAEVLGGVHDVEWPQWYAEHMARALATDGYQITRIQA
jgi:hypothetical protein